MKYILIPVKDLDQAKQRLACLMTQEERTSLAWLMLQRVFSEVAATPGYDRVAVVTCYEPAIGLGQQLGFEILRETEQVSESSSVDQASQVVCASGAISVLRLPIDLPLVISADIATLLDRSGKNCDCPAAVIAVSRDGSGTNALSRTPPDLFPSHFGPDSLVKHRAEAIRCQARCEVLYLPSVACDMDDPSDVAFFLRQGAKNHVYDFLMDLRIDRRLKKIEAASGR